jgi:putative ABC transport system permease protein
VFLENLIVALKSLWSNKMRSFLTTLGIVIGVAAVIAVVSIVQGFSQVITAEIENLGSNSVVIGPRRPPGKEGEKLSRVELTFEDGLALVAASRYVEAVAPIIQQFGRVKAGEESGDYPVLGTTPIFQDLRNYYVESGRFFSAVDDRERQKVCVVGHGLLKELKLPANPLGRTLTVAGDAYRIIGVMEAKGQLLGQDFDKFVMIPFGTAVGVYGDNVSKQVALLVHVKAAANVDRATAEMENFLRIRHRLRSDQPNDFEITSQTQILKSFSKFANGVTYVVAGVVSIALLVGGIGIMNIMLVSVTERTREIGVRKAVGARRSHIMVQFVIEAVVLALMGGTVGILLGVLTGMLAAKLIPNWPGAFVPIWSVFLSFGFSSAVGLFFGIYPAAKAARLDPIESLRYE